MNKLVIDTNIIVAIVDDKDVHHKKALNLVIGIENNNNNPVVLMDCVVNEVYSVIARRSIQRGYSFKEVVLKMDNVMNSI
jgi:predicted nucleic acid-binding protein